ncbi:hypothetical protein Droror1_Dr00009587 [Drosera rotundifolia]
MAEETVKKKLRCQRIGCDAFFTEDDNPEGSCTYHDSPLFHDGTKEWTCCKKRSHDFTLFLQIPGCKSGKHTTEKPVSEKPAPRSSNLMPAPVPVKASPEVASSKDACARCRQGFFCSDHGSQSKEISKKTSNPAASSAAEGDVGTSAPPKKIVDINTPQICRNKGCGKTFKEIDNHDSACTYHPGPAVFRDRLRGWKCCDIHVKEFDEFIAIPPCSRGWHNADAS